MSDDITIDRLPELADDRKRWPFGPWDDEPDFRQWADPKTGLACMVIRNNMGALCGYAGVPEGHCLYGLQYSDHLPNWAASLGEALLESTGGIDAEDGVGVVDVLLAALDGGGIGALTVGLVLRAHGGITYSGTHETFARPPFEDHWWFGFDCAHAGDLVPGMLTFNMLLSSGGFRRDDPLTQKLQDIQKFMDKAVTSRPADEYRTLAYVENWTSRLALQIDNIAKLENLETRSE